MSEPARAPRTDPRVLAAFVTGGWIACVVAAFGVVSLLLDVDVIRQADAGPLLGPIMVVAAAVVLALLLVRVQTALQGAGVSFVGCAAGVYLVLLLVGGVGYTLITAEIAQLLFFPLDYAASPFVVSAAVLAGLAGVVAHAIASRPEGAGPPRWPWEKREDG